MEYSYSEKVFTGKAPTMLTAGKLDEVELTKLTSRQHRRCIIPQAVTHSLVLLRMGEIIPRNMLS